MIVKVITSLNELLWGDLFILEFSNGETRFGISLLVIILIPAGIYFTCKTRFLPFRLFPEMVRVTLEKKSSNEKGSISGLQALIIATATRVGMGNLAGVVAAISFGGAGAVFWTPLLNQPWLRFIKRRILFMADLGEVRPISWTA